jgi:hypothetical protein
MRKPIQRRRVLLVKKFGLRSLVAVDAGVSLCRFSSVTAGLMSKRFAM